MMLPTDMQQSKLDATICLANHPDTIICQVMVEVVSDRDVIAAGVSKSGCTVHFVDSGMDTGPIIDQAEVEVKPDDDEDSLAEKVKQLENVLYPSVIDKLSEGKIQSP